MCKTDTLLFDVWIIHQQEIINPDTYVKVKGVLSVRPNLNYLDKSDKRAKVEGIIPLLLLLFI